MKVKKLNHYTLKVLRDKINEKFGDKIKVKNLSADRIEIDGTGRNTESLVNYALDKKRTARIPYGHVWCVFDKDSFTDEQFNSAVQTCCSNSLGAAWTNEAIELWFILHFEYLNTGINRHQYIDKLNEYFRFYGINGGKYEKNIEAIYEVLNTYGEVTNAIKYAKKLEKTFEEGITPSNRIPSTQIHHLIEELFDYLDN